MIEYYLEVRTVHMLAAIASGCLFLLRGVAVRAGRVNWALAPAVRYLSYTIDTTLLAAALMLVTMLPPAVFSNGWLFAKLALLPLYVALGWFALRRPAGSSQQLASFVGAVLAYGLMFAIARTHDPWGPLHLLTGS